MDALNRAYQRIDDLDREIAAKDAKIATKDAEIKELQVQWQQCSDPALEAKLHQRIAQLQHDKRELQQQYNRLVDLRSIAAKDAEIATKDAEIKELQVERRKVDDDRTRASLKEEIAELQRDKRELQQQYNRLVDARSKLEERLAAAAAAQPPAAPPDANARFEQLLRSTYINKPNQDVMRRIRSDYANYLVVVKDADEAVDLYIKVKDMVGSTTRRHMQTQHGLALDGPLFLGGNVLSSLVKANDAEGRLKVVKLIKNSVLPAGSCELPGGTEAAAVRAICMGASKPAGLAIVDAEVLPLALTMEHKETGHGPGTYAAVVMPQYGGCVVNLSQVSQHVLAKQGARLEQAVEYIHSLDLVHMDIKGANILVDVAGQWALADFGGVVPVGSAIKEVTQQFAPEPKLCGKPAKKQYDWHMLAVALAVELHPDTWREQLVENDPDWGMYAPMQKLKTAIQAASCPALVELFDRILGKCSGSTPSIVSQ